VLGASPDVPDGAVGTPGGAGVVGGDDVVEATVVEVESSAGSVIVWATAPWSWPRRQEAVSASR